SKYVQTTWLGPATRQTQHQSFLANSFDEALSGAIKLARYSGNLGHRSPSGLVIDGAGRLGPFASAAVQGGRRIEFVPKRVVAGNDTPDLNAVCRCGERFGFVVVVGSSGSSLRRGAEALQGLVREQAPLLITCVDRADLSACRQDPSSPLRALTPDVVV